MSPFSAGGQRRSLASTTRRAARQSPSGLKTPRTLRTIAAAHWELGGAGVLLANPPPQSIDVEGLIESALTEAEELGTTGQGLTPFVLARLHEESGGQTLDANRRLATANAQLAAEVAVAYASMSRELRFDFPGLRVGVAEYEDGPTGCTVFHLPPGGAACSVDIRGGSPGTIGNYEWAHAVCFAGGSLYGLEAACGVSAELMAMRGYTVGWTDVELTLGAIVYDFGRRDNAIYPDAELGRTALRAAREGVFPLGRRGAGRSVTVGKTFGFEHGEFSGQGGAFRIVGPTRIAVFTVVNAFGAIVDRQGTSSADTTTRSAKHDSRSSTHWRRSFPKRLRATRRSRSSSRTSASTGGSCGSSASRCTPRWRGRSSPFTRSWTATCSIRSRPARSRTTIFRA